MFVSTSAVERAIGFYHLSQSGDPLPAAIAVDPVRVRKSLRRLSNVLMSAKGCVKGSPDSAHGSAHAHRGVESEPVWFANPRSLDDS